MPGSRGVKAKGRARRRPVERPASLGCGQMTGTLVERTKPRQAAARSAFGIPAPASSDPPPDSRLGLSLAVGPSSPPIPPLPPVQTFLPLIPNPCFIRVSSVAPFPPAPPRLRAPSPLLATDTLPRTGVNKRDRGAGPILSGTLAPRVAPNLDCQRSDSCVGRLQNSDLFFLSPPFSFFPPLPPFPPARPSTLPLPMGWPKI